MMNASAGRYDRTAHQLVGNPEVLHEAIEILLWRLRDIHVVVMHKGFDKVACSSTMSPQITRVTRQACIPSNANNLRRSCGKCGLAVPLCIRMVESFLSRPEVLTFIRAFTRRLSLHSVTMLSFVMTQAIAMPLTSYGVHAQLQQAHAHDV